MCDQFRSLFAKMPSLSNEQKAVVSFVSLLGVTGIALFIWMAGTQWADKTGLVVSVIFVVLTGLQVCLSVLWWRVSKWSKFAEHVPTAVNNVDEESVEMLKRKEAMQDKSNANGNNGSVLPQDLEPLRHRGDGDQVTSVA